MQFWCFHQWRSLSSLYLPIFCPTIPITSATRTIIFGATTNNAEAFYQSVVLAPKGTIQRLHAIEHRTYYSPPDDPQINRALYQALIAAMAISTPLLQQAAVVSNPGENYSISLQSDIPVATPGKNEILVKLTCTGLW